MKKSSDLLINITIILAILVKLFSFICDSFVNEDINVKYKQEIVEDFLEFDVMYTTDYTENKDSGNCGPTATCNIISYLETQNNEMYIEKELNGKVSQEAYEEVCEGVLYKEEKGTTALNIINFLENYFDENTNRDCDVEYRKYNKWESIKNAVENDRIIMLGYKSHVYIIGGYEIKNGERKVIVFTNWEEMPYAYIDYDKEMALYEIELQ